MLTKYSLLLVAGCVTELTSAQRSGAHRNVLHWTPLKYMGPPSATLATPDNDFHVYYRAPFGKASGAPYQWKETRTKDFVRWEDGDAFAASSSNPQNSYESGVVYPNPVDPKQRPSGDTTYNVLLSRQSSTATLVTSRGSNDGIRSFLVKSSVKPTWSLADATAVDAFPLQGLYFVAYLKKNDCQWVYFALDGRTPPTDYLSRWQTPFKDMTGTCTNLNVKRLSDHLWMIAMTRIPHSQNKPQTQYWVGALSYDPSGGTTPIKFVVDSSFSRGTDFFLDDGTDAAYFRLGRVGGALKAIGYISGGPNSPYPEGLYNSLTLVRGLSWANGLQQTLPKMATPGGYKRKSTKDAPLPDSKCLNIPLTGRDVRQKVIPAIEAGWVFELLFEEADASSGWEVQFRTGKSSGKTAQYIKVSYDGRNVLLDRSNAKSIGLKDSASKALQGRRTGPVIMVLDKAALEVYVNSTDAPTTVMTMSYWTDKPITDVCILAKGKPGRLLAGSKWYQVRSIWSDDTTPEPAATTPNPAATTPNPAATTPNPAATTPNAATTTRGAGASPLNAGAVSFLIGMIVLAFAI